MSIRLLVLMLVAATVSAKVPSKQWEGPLPPVEDFSPKIINGVDAQDNQFPYMVSLNYQGDGHACGASIIAPNWVLTAAHCCLTGYPLDVYAGSVVLSGGGQVYGIAQYVVHPNYDPNSNWRNDICAIRLNQNLQFSDRVQQVTLPPQGWQVNNNDLVLISGWGYTTPSGNQVIPDRMQVGYNFRALSNQECASRTGVSMIDGYLCAVGANQGQGVCQGDSGSPLMKDGVQVGIVSWVYLPCGSGLPDFYARVPNYIDWIRSVLGRDAQHLKFAEH